ncbi:Sec-independent protein translocase protein TatB [Pseudomonas sp. MH9.2]|uniref:Sec-independent protein translocase protein TatB n=1 Tax=Pseudomonas sp. MH9.2 TaxID=3048629 RepID=UPI002AC90675|nr:Sec-independent protein translocase protein TatB [Pseudomonas sp. MH9.2]MEB0026661.1 Sec-independent protein translocase protein TatB [Pseudomonas sp. MH9.2]WPX67413.1 Sec-independent protein translocase protein TatB [Pseudomonas sp. MH9.2]
MFGISFSELLLVGLVALLVLGPERLPGAARTAGLWVGRLKRSFNAIKQEVEREIGADEIRRQLHNEHILSLEQEAKKIFAPQQAPVEPVATVSPPVEAQTIAPPTPASQPETPVVATEPVVVVPVPVAPAAPAAPAEAAPVAHVSPVPSAPPVNDSSLPPRAP